MDLISIVMPENVDPGEIVTPLADVSRIPRKYLDIPYYDRLYPGDPGRQALDIYLPEEGDGPFPVIVFIHGGAFWGGQRRDFQIGHVIEGILRGYAVVSVGYRLSDTVKFPDAIYDVKAAVRFLRANAEKYHLDPDRFCAVGASAGAYFAAMLAVTGGMLPFEDITMGNHETSDAVQAVIGLFGVYDLFEQSKFTEASEPAPGMPKMANWADLFMGLNCREHEGLMMLTWPGSYIKPDCPPFLLQAGTGDEIVPYETTRLLGEMINSVCGEGRAVVDIFEGCAHGDIRFSEKENLDRMFAFTDAALGRS